MKKQNEVTMNLQNEHTKMRNDITVAENKINDLKTRRDVLNTVIQEILAEKRQIDKTGLELQESIDGRSMNED